MELPPVTHYHHAFFDAMTPGSLRSARVILPMVFDAVHPRSVLDVGCGVGTWLRVVNELGVSDLAGVDGPYIEPEALLIPSEAFAAVDLEVPLDLGRRFDLVMTLEVAEHLAASAAATFVASLVRHGDVVLFSAAIPAQGGTHHINEQWPAYWAALFAEHGYIATDGVRSRCWLEPAVEPWYAQNVLIFVREACLAQFPKLASSRVPGGTPLPLVHPEIYRITAERPSQPPVPSAYGEEIAPEPAPADGGSRAKRFVAVVYADEIAENADILRACVAEFGLAPDASLMIYAPDRDPEAVLRDLGDTLREAGICDEDGPDASLLCVPREEGDQFVAGEANVAVSTRPATGRLKDVPHVPPEGLSRLRGGAAPS